MIIFIECMKQKSIPYIYKLDRSSHLVVYRIQPGLRLQDLIRKNIKEGGTPLRDDTLKNLTNELVILHSVSDLRNIEDKIHIKDEPYEIPAILQPFAEEVIAELQRKNPSAFPGPVMSSRFGSDGEINIVRGNYFQFFACEKSFDKIPADYARNPSGFPEGKTLAEIVREGKLLSRNDMVNYLGVAFFIIDSENRLGFVQRGKGNTVVSGLAVSGSTPPFVDYTTWVDDRLKENGQKDVPLEARIPLYEKARELMGPKKPCAYGFFSPNFSFPEYIERNIAKELKEEFKLEPRDYQIVQYHIVKNQMWIPDSVPFIAAVIRAKKPWEKIASDCYGDANVINEHPVVFSIAATPKAWNSLIDTMRIHETTAYVGSVIVNDMHRGKY